MESKSESKQAVSEMPPLHKSGSGSRKSLAVDVAAKAPPGQQSIYDYNGSDAFADKTADCDLPPSVVRGTRRGDWEMIEDPSVGVYFYNNVTNESSWEAPDVFMELSPRHSKPKPKLLSQVVSRTFSFKDARQASSRALLEDPNAVSVKGVRHGHWEEVRDPTAGSVYYYNHDTKESVWEMPDAFRDWTEDDEKAYAAESSSLLATAFGSDGASTVGPGSVYSRSSSRALLADAFAETMLSAGDNAAHTESKSPRDDEDAALYVAGDWAAYQDPESGMEYYCNVVTGETTWEPPPEVMAHWEETVGDPDMVEAALAAARQQLQDSAHFVGSVGDWDIVNDADSGCVYFVDSRTGESCWDPPEEVAAVWSSTASPLDTGLHGSFSVPHTAKLPAAVSTSANSGALPEIKLGKLPPLGASSSAEPTSLGDGLEALLGAGGAAALAAPKTGSLAALRTEKHGGGTLAAVESRPHRKKKKKEKEKEKRHHRRKPRALSLRPGAGDDVPEPPTSLSGRPRVMAGGSGAAMLSTPKRTGSRRALPHSTSRSSMSRAPVIPVDLSVTGSGFSSTPTGAVSMSMGKAPLGVEEVEQGEKEEPKGDWVASRVVPPQAARHPSPPFADVSPIVSPTRKASSAFSQPSSPQASAPAHVPPRSAGPTSPPHRNVAPAPSRPSDSPAPTGVPAWRPPLPAGDGGSTTRIMVGSRPPPPSSAGSPPPPKPRGMVSVTVVSRGGPPRRPPPPARGLAMPGRTRDTDASVHGQFEERAFHVMHTADAKALAAEPTRDRKLSVQMQMMRRVSAGLKPAAPPKKNSVSAMSATVVRRQLVQAAAARNIASQAPRDPLLEAPQRRGTLTALRPAASLTPEPPGGGGTLPPPRNGGAHTSLGFVARPLGGPATGEAGRGLFKAGFEGGMVRPRPLPAL